MSIGINVDGVAKNPVSIFAGINGEKKKIKEVYLNKNGLPVLGYREANDDEIIKGFVTVDSSFSHIAYSIDGEHWNTFDKIEAPYILKNSLICYGGDRFVCVGYEKSYRSLYSLDGKTWHEMTGLQNVKYNDIVYGNNMFVCVGNDGYVSYSTDGETWGNIKVGANGNFSSITYGNGRFVCLGSVKPTGSAVYTIYYSTTGNSGWKAMTRSNTTSSTNNPHRVITYGGNRYVWLDQSGYSFYSTNGTSYSYISSSPQVGFSPQAICFGNGKFICHNSYSLYQTTNGSSWTKVDSFPYVSLSSFIYNKDRFIAVGQQGKAYYSINGEDWYEMTGLENSSFYSTLTYKEG